MNTQPQDDGPATAQEAAPEAPADQGDAPALAVGDDVRAGPERSDEPEAGATEPAD